MHVQFPTLVRIFLATATLAVALPCHALRADGPPAGNVRVAELAGQEFTSIQAALDAAPANGRIVIGPGRYDERLRIGKPITLVGSGPDKTVVGPTTESRQALIDRLEQQAKFLDARDAEKPANPASAFKEIQTMVAALEEPIVKLEGIDQVELRSLLITSPGTPRAGRGLSVAGAIDVNAASLRMADCAVVGCFANGIRAQGGAQLDIEDCLVAACWGTGVGVSNRVPGSLRIVNSDIRNCYHTNIWTGPYSNPCSIEGCRISGSAFFGIRYGERRPQITRNAIFENARAAIYDEGEGGVVTQNVFYKNAGGGVACWFRSKPQIEGNLFLSTGSTAIYVNGSCEPMIRGNVFVDSDYAVCYAPVEILKQEPLGRYEVHENLFWQIKDSVARQYPATPAADARIRPIELPSDAGNRVVDPQIAMGPENQVTIKSDSPTRQLDPAALASISLKSRWPITPEERAMIPDDGTREWSKWKMRPRDRQ
jgi:hypothetical protein